MSKYGFNYCAQKAELLNEMAQHSVWRKMTDMEGDEDIKSKYAAFNTLFKDVRNKLKGKGNVQRMVLDYLIISIYDQNIQGTVINQIAQEYVNEHPEEYDEWKTKMQKTRGTKYENQQTLPRKEFFLTNLVKDNIDEILTSEFREKVLSPENIEEYVDSMHGVDASNISYIAAFEKKRKKEDFGVDLKPYYKENYEGSELAKQINKITRQLSKGNKDGEVVEDDSQTPDQYYAQAVYDEVATILPQKKEMGVEDAGEKSIWGSSEEPSGKKTQSQWRNHFAKNINSEDLNDLLTFLDNKINQGFGVTDELMNKLGDLVAQKSPKMKKFIQYLIVIGNSEISMRNPSDESEDYPGYNAKALAKVLDTPEKEEIFRNWYHLYKNGQKKNFSDIKKASQAFIDNRGLEEEPVESSTDSTSVEQDPIDVEIDQLTQQIFSSNSIKEIKQLKKKIEQLQQQKSGNLEEEPISESVMGYMTEQISSDRKIHKREVKFDGKKYRKPINYAHWMAMNKD